MIIILYSDFLPIFSYQVLQSGKLMVNKIASYLKLPSSQVHLSFIPRLKLVK